MTDTLILSLAHTLTWMFVGALAWLLGLVRGNLVALRAHVWFVRWRTWTVIAVVTLGALWLGGTAALALVLLIAWQAAREGAALLRLTPVYRRALTALAPLASLAVGLWPWLLPWLPALAALVFALLTFARGRHDPASGSCPPLLLGEGSGVRVCASTRKQGTLTLTLSLGERGLDHGQASHHRLVDAVRAGLAFVWTAWPLAWVVWLGQSPDGIAWIVVFGVTVGLADVGACIAGSALGGPRLAPTISPGKRWSGLLGAVAAAYAAFALLAPLRPSLPLGVEIALPLLLALTGALGDLVESWVKRSAGVKDAGAWLPGFGGLLDRIDSALLALPVGYLALWLAAW